MNETADNKPYYPACVIAFLIVLAFGACNICQLYLLKDNYPVSKLWVGSDYACVYSATQNIIRGGSPYENKWTFPPLAAQFFDPSIYKNDSSPWYTYTPIPAYLNYPFVYFDIDTASRLMFFILIAVVISAYALINSCFAEMERGDRKIIFLCGLIIIVLSYPFYFLILRGHFIGIVILLLAAGLYLFQKNNSLCSICFGLSIGLIIFPALILFPLLLFRRYKIIIYTLITIISLVLICPGLWFEFLTKMLIPRTLGEGWYMIEQNCSLTNTFFLLSLLINKMFATIGFPRFPVNYCYLLSHITNLIIFSTMAITDFQIRKKYRPWNKEIEIALMMMYLPFMIAVPIVSFQYGLVLVILLVPVLCALIKKLEKPMPKIILWILIGGIFLSQIQANSFQTLLNPNHMFFHFFPGFGLFLVMIGCMTFKLWFWRRTVLQVG
jgi:hypothetical protein